MDTNVYYLKKIKNLLIHENESYELLLSFDMKEMCNLLEEDEEKLDIKLFKDEFEDVKKNDLFNEMTKHELEKNKKLIKHINILLTRNCSHDYESDYIESSIEGTLHKIHYCRYCELNKYDILNSNS
tara:strand:- start:7762 stop:8142 length:381 start_codon:yes stop_codon:yes gene_type:complete